MDQRLSYLYGLERKGIKVGLSHTVDLLERCGNPHRNYPSIHVAGTNGKGSTSAIIASILQEYGYKVGLYTSPHLIRFNERIRVNGTPINDAAIIAFMESNQKAIEEIDSTFFEATTAMAFHYFSKEKVDVAVVETGLGGRLDSTNVIHPEVTVITPVDMDHSHLLGPTIEDIAREKAGIIKKQTPLVLAKQTKSVHKIISDRARELYADVIIPDKPVNIQTNKNGTTFSWMGERYSIPLLGCYQAENATIAMEASKRFDHGISYDIFRKGLKRISWPGRLQVLSVKPWILYDVAHNPHGIRSVLETIQSISAKNPIGIMCLKMDKELDDIIHEISTLFDTLLVSSGNHPDLFDSESLGKALKTKGVSVPVYQEIDQAIRWLKAELGPNQAGLIFGSHYIASEVFEAFDYSFDSGEI